MAKSKTTPVLIALLAASVSVSALARGNGRSGHAHSSAGARAHTNHGGAHHHGFARSARIGFFLGAPVFAAPYFYPSPRNYYPPPPVYIQQNPDQPYWYYCPEANGYYPQVQACPGGWQQVLPQPAPTGPGY